MANPNVKPTQSIEDAFPSTRLETLVQILIEQNVEIIRILKEILNREG